MCPMYYNYLTTPISNKKVWLLSLTEALEALDSANLLDISGSLKNRHDTEGKAALFYFVSIGKHIYRKILTQKSKLKVEGISYIS